MSGAACFECGAPAEHDHHVVPRSRGGTRTIPLCTSCHAKAHHRSGNMATGRLTSEAMRQKRARGEYTGGRVRYGYRVGADGVSLVEDEAEQAVILLVLAMRRVGGMSLRSVAEQLESRGVLSRTGRRLTHRAIANIERDAEQGTVSYRKMCQVLESLGFLSRAGKPFKPQSLVRIIKSASRAPSSPQALD